MKPLQGGVSENRLQWSGGHHSHQGHANQNQINFEASCFFFLAVSVRCQLTLMILNLHLFDI